MKEKYKVFKGKIALSEILIMNFIHVTNGDSVNISIIKDNNKNSISACKIQSLTEAVRVV